MELPAVHQSPEALYQLIKDNSVDLTSDFKGVDDHGGSHQLQVLLEIREGPQQVHYESRLVSKFLNGVKVEGKDLEEQFDQVEVVVEFNGVGLLNEGLDLEVIVKMLVELYFEGVVVLKGVDQLGQLPELVQGGPPIILIHEIKLGSKFYEFKVEGVVVAGLYQEVDSHGADKWVGLPDTPQVGSKGAGQHQVVARLIRYFLKLIEQLTVVPGAYKL